MNIYKYLNEAKRVFVVDAGKTLQAKDKNGKTLFKIPRYAVWDRNEVVETDDDLDKLLKNYKLTKDDVVTMDI